MLILAPATEIGVAGPRNAEEDVPFRGAHEEEHMIEKLMETFKQIK